MIERTFSTAHCHPRSLDSASTPKAFAEREVELGSGTITCTDHGSLSAVYDCWKLGKDKGLIAIPGLEAYFRDDDCPLLKKLGVPQTATVPRGMDKEKWAAEHPSGSFYDYNKYYHLTLHFRDYDAYLAGVRLLSKADLRAERHGSETKPLFAWPEIEELASHNVTATTSCLVGMVQRHLLNEEAGSPRVAAAKAYAEHLHHLFGDRFYAGVFPHNCTHNWTDKVVITYEDGTSVSHNGSKLLRTDNRECYAHEFAKNFPAWGTKLMAVSHYRKWADEAEPKKIVSVEHKEGFVQNECKPWAPGGDVQWGTNKLILQFAKKMGLKVLLEDDSHFANPEDKVVQDVRLAQHGGAFRFHNSYHRQSNQEAFDYFEKLGIDETTFDSWVTNSHEWADGFKGFKFDTSLKLPNKFFPSDSLGRVRELIAMHGRLPDDQVYRDRLETELKLLHDNGKADLLPYFLLNEENCRVHANQGELLGIGRGSVGGSLVAYLLRITHIDPIEYDLSFDRFLTLDRVQKGKFPDIDQDFPRRDFLLGYDTHVIEFEAEDGTKHIVPETMRVDTDQGVLTIQEAIDKGASMMSPWWVKPE